MTIIGQENNALLNDDLLRFCQKLPWETTSFHWRNQSSQKTFFQSNLLTKVVSKCKTTTCLICLLNCWSVCFNFFHIPIPQESELLDLSWIFDNSTSAWVCKDWNWQTSVLNVEFSASASKSAHQNMMHHISISIWNFAGDLDYLQTANWNLPSSGWQSRSVWLESQAPYGDISVPQIDCVNLVQTCIFTA